MLGPWHFLPPDGAERVRGRGRIRQGLKRESQVVLGSL